MLDLNELDTDDIPGVTREKGNSMAQAAAVCLEEQRHAQGVPFRVRGGIINSYDLVWTPVTEQARRTWYDLREATEEGAAGIAALLAELEIGYSVILRSRRNGGFDYWLGDSDTFEVSDAERKATSELGDLIQGENLVARVRLEVSGILNGSDGIVTKRVRDKILQMDPSDHLGLPAYAIVVEFGRPLAEVREK